MTNEIKSDLILKILDSVAEAIDNNIPSIDDVDKAIGEAEDNLQSIRDEVTDIEDYLSSLRKDTINAIEDHIKTFFEENPMGMPDETKASISIAINRVMLAQHTMSVEINNLVTVAKACGISTNSATYIDSKDVINE